MTAERVSMNRILVVRGGAIGDFVLTLPAIKLLRDRFPKAQIEILGYKHIAALAEGRFYAEAIRSLESGELARFFAKDSELPAEWANYFAAFDLVISYLFDPDGIFQTNLKRAGAKTFMAGPSKLDNSEHAARQLARPLAALGLHLTDPAARLFPNDSDRTLANSLLSEDETPGCAPSEQRQRDQELVDRKLDSAGRFAPDGRPPPSGYRGRSG
jgi:heptosyltransferase-3